MKEKLIDLINDDNFDTARELLEKNPDLVNDEVFCILAATVYEEFEEKNKVLRYIERGLAINPTNYELYYMLGNYYSHTNPNQAFLCYENAEYYCKKQCSTDSEDYYFVHSVKASFEQEQQLTVSPVSIVILSYNSLDITKLCIKSIRMQCNPDSYDIIVIDNASTDGSMEWLKEQNDIKLIANTENVGFPAGCNQGILVSAPKNDIFLLNNDTIVTQNALFTLRMGLYSSDSIGASGSVTNYAGNHQTINEVFDSPNDYVKFAEKNNIPNHNALEYKTWLVGFAMLIKRSALDKVGLLDTLFTPGNYEDNDICVRLSKEGYSMVLCHNSFIYHWGSVSFNSIGEQKFVNICNNNRQKFIDKWGFQPNYYSNIREDLLSFIDNDYPEKINVLEIGCGAGLTLARIKYLFPNSNVYGIELMPEIAAMADKSLNIITGNIETMDLPYEEGYFDYIICGDVIEHLISPEAAIKKLKHCLKDNGCILASIPNLMNAEVIYNLLRGYFTYEDAGIRDRTHLKFFTYNEIIGLFSNLGFNIIDSSRSIVPSCSTEAYKDFFDKLLAIEDVADKMFFDSYQYLVKAMKRK